MHFSAFFFKPEQNVAALSITDLGVKNCGVSVPISSTKSTVLSIMYMSPNQLMIGIFELPSYWSNLSRLRVPDFL